MIARWGRGRYFGNSGEKKREKKELNRQKGHRAAEGLLGTGQYRQ